MPAQPEVVVKVSEEGIDAVGDKLDKLKDKTTSWFSRLPKDLQRDLKKAGDAMADGVGHAITGSIKAAGLAMAGPGMTSFDQALTKANNFRDATARVAVSSGKDFDGIGKKVLGISRTIGEMPGAVTAWGRSAARAGGDFGTAVDALGAFKDRALALDRPLEDLQGSMDSLRRGFGIEGARDVGRFFGTMDAQAEKAGVSIKRLGGQWQAFEDRFARMGTARGGAGIFSGMTAAFAASSPNQDAAQGAQAFGMGTLNQGARLTEMRMRRSGFGKNFSITDDNGEVDPKRYVQAMRFMQKDMLRFYGGNKRRAIEVQAGENLEGRRDVGAFLNTNFDKVEDLAKLPPEERKRLDRFMGLTNGRSQRDAGKEGRDIEAGGVMLPAQDAAVDVGGGAAGLAMGQAVGLFSTAVDRFGGLVANMGSYATSPAAAGAAGSAGAGALGTLGKVGKVAGGLAAIGAAGYAGWELGSYIDTATGASDWISKKAFNLMNPGESDRIPMSGGNPANEPRRLADAIADRTLKVQIVQDAPQPAQAPKGRSSR